ncbi:unnamed protein product, partial [Ectocarpus sp. 6 AP-2014]
PDNWQEDTRFDGPEHWGMEKRWKSLFPKTGFKTKSGGGIVDTSRDKDGGRSRAKGTRNATVDMTAEGDDDTVTCSLQSGDDHFANFKQPSRAARRTVPETAPEDPEEKMPLPSYRRPNAKTTATSGSSINTSSIGKVPLYEDEEPTTGQRRWRIQPRSTEPASSSRAGSRARDSVLLPSSSEEEEEEEEEFDESEANITGHERNNSRSPIPRPREHKNGGGSAESPPFPLPPHSNKKGKGSRCSPGGGAAAFPYGDDSPSRQRHEEEIESSGSESCGGLSNSDFDGSGGEGRKPSSSSRRLSSSSSLSRRRKGGGEGEGTRRTNGGGAKGKGHVVREGGRRRRGSSSHSRMGNNTSSSPIPGSAQGARARSAPSGSKKARKVVKAQGNEQGWIAKGGGSVGGGSSGEQVRNPVLSFQGSQISMRKNNERSLTQSKINFPVVL